MNPKREALLGRFRARSLDRVRETGLSLQELEAGRGSAELLEQVARELHTLKGDSRVVGLDAVSELAHAAEDLLLGDRPGEAPSPAACARVRGALEAAARVLRQELDQEAADQAMREAREALSQGWTPEASEARPAMREALSPGWTSEANAARPQAPGAPGLHPESGPAAEPRAVRRSPSADERWMYVKLSRVDEICERVSDLSAEFRALLFELGQHTAQGATAAQLRPLAEGADRCRAKLEDAVASAWSLRLVPVEPALEELVGHARELARSQGKQVRVTVRSGGAEVERGVLDALQEPLLHLVRNAVDHGLERAEERGDKGAEGSLTLRASSVGPTLVIEVSDDGRGVDVGAVRQAAVARGLFEPGTAERLDERSLLELLFRHGFTTRRKVSEVSGRGVGLDVVRERLDALGGTAEVATVRGKGTTFKLAVPSTLTRERALVVECGGALYGLPAAQVLEVVRLTDTPRQAVAGGSALRFRDELVPSSVLSQVLGTVDPEPPVWAAVLGVGSRRWAVSVATLLGEQELLRRPLDLLLARFEHLAASATLDDGRLVLLLSAPGLLRRHEAMGAARSPTAAATRARPRVLVVDDSLTIVDLMRELLADAGFEVRHAAQGKAALELMLGWAPDLVLADVDMPVMDGFELLRQIRLRWLHLPVVMLTTRGSAEDRRHAASLGASAYLVKSQFEESTLLETVRRFVGAAP